MTGDKRDAAKYIKSRSAKNGILSGDVYINTQGKTVKQLHYTCK
jgi:hypothetical protein